MSWVRVWIHAVFTTINRDALIDKSFRQPLFEHMKANAKKKEIILIEVNGYVDHVHCLFSINKEMSISKVLQLIKGESSHWINKNNFINGKFKWQDDYWAVSVSESHLNLVRNYIQNQEQHHKKKSFNEEIEIFNKKYKWS